MGEEISRLMDGELDDARSSSPCAAELDAARRRGDVGVLPRDRRRAARLGCADARIRARASPCGSRPSRRYWRRGAQTRDPLPLAWAVAATVAAVAVVGWVAVATIDPPPTALARAREAGAVRARAGAPASQVPADYLLAHQEYSPDHADPGRRPESARRFDVEHRAARL